jgi:hypothetical protein
MQISFDTEKFKGRGRESKLIDILANLDLMGLYFHGQYNKDVEEVVCRTPSSAYPHIGVRYLQSVRRKSFADEAVQKKFWKKLLKRPEVAVEYCSAFQVRLTEEEEEIFVHDIASMVRYSNRVIGGEGRGRIGQHGKFPERVHNMILLKSYEHLTEREKHLLQKYIGNCEK